MPILYVLGCKARVSHWCLYPLGLSRKKTTLLNGPTSQLPLVRMRWQKFSVSAATLSLNPNMLSSRASPPSGGRERDLLSCPEPAKGRWWPCFVDRGFLRFVFVADLRHQQERCAKPCRMNTCTKMVGGWGTCLRCGFSAGRVQPVRTSRTWRYAPYW